MHPLGSRLVLHELAMPPVHALSADLVFGRVLQGFDDPLIVDAEGGFEAFWEQHQGDKRKLADAGSTWELPGAKLQRLEVLSSE